MVPTSYWALWQTSDQSHDWKRQREALAGRRNEARLGELNWFAEPAETGVG